MRDELRFLVAKHGTDAIERIADWLAMCGPAPLPALLAAAVVRTDRRSLDVRLAWCRRHAALLFGAEDICRG